MHFATMVVGEHTYEDDLEPLEKAGKADYFSITQGNFIRRRPGIQLYELKWLFSKLKKQLIYSTLEGEVSEEMYNRTIAVFSDPDIERAGNVDWVQMSQQAFEEDMEITKSYIERFPQSYTSGNFPFFYHKYNADEMTLEEYVWMENLWAPPVICDFRGLPESNTWWERKYDDNVVQQRKEQHEFILNLPVDTLVTLYHCHV